MDSASRHASAAPQEEIPVDLDVPLFSGDAEPLKAFRGRPVVLLLASSDAPGWSDFRDHFERRLAADLSSPLAVIVVANDADARALQAEWDRDPPPFVLGWDPAGAMALRLGISRLPAVFVLNAEGHVVGSLGTLDTASLRTVDEWVAASAVPAE